MLRIAEIRRMGNKETEFIRRGKPVEPTKLRRFAKRHKLTPERAASMLDEPGILFLAAGFLGGWSDRGVWQ